MLKKARLIFPEDRQGHKHWGFGEGKRIAGVGRKDHLIVRQEYTESFSGINKILFRSNS